MTTEGHQSHTHNARKLYKRELWHCYCTVMVLDKKPWWYSDTLQSGIKMPLFVNLRTPTHTSHVYLTQTHTFVCGCLNTWWGSGLIIHRTSLHPCSRPPLMMDHPLPCRRGERQAYLRGRRAACEWLDSRSSGAMAMWQHTFPFGWKIWLMWLTLSVCVKERGWARQVHIHL